jgi:hypothetical protein
MRCLSVEVTRAVPLRYKLGWDAKFSQTKEKITGRVLLRTTVTVPDTTADIDLATVARCPRDVKKAEKNAERGIGYLEVWLSLDPFCVISAPTCERSLDSLRDVSALAGHSDLRGAAARDRPRRNVRPVRGAGGWGQEAKDDDGQEPKP